MVLRMSNERFSIGHISSKMKHTFSILAICASCVASIASSSPHASTDRCYRIGDVVNVVGKASLSVNGGTTFDLLKPICVHYPRDRDRLTVHDLTTTRSKVEADIFLTVTGRLSDPFPIYGVGIDVLASQNINDEIVRSQEASKKACEDWRAENRDNLRARTHGGSVGWYDALNPDGSPNCCLMAADTRLPHNVSTICMRTGG
jgi:hypothetical protein